MTTVAAVPLTLIALLLGTALGWLVHAVRRPDRSAQSTAEANARYESTRDELARARLDLTAAQADADDLRDQLARCQAARARAEADATAVREQLEQVREDREHMVAQVKAVSGDVLKAQAEELARQQAKEAGERAASVEALVKPLAEQLVRFDEKVERLEGERRTAAGALGEQLKALEAGVGQLGKNADGLVTALRRPNVRGSWGELQLQTAFEHAGLVEGVNFELQETLAGEDAGRLRPDAVVRIGGGKLIAVDAKVPYAAYEEAVAAGDPEAAKVLMARHAGHVRTHIRQLAGREYQAALRTAGHGTPDFVVLFIPSEAMYFAALEADPSLLGEALRSKVLLAAPMSLMAILHAVHVGWQQEQIAQDVREIATIATELHKRFATFFEHFAAIGGSLGKAVGKYNAAVGSFEGSVVPQVRRLEDHQIASSKTLPAVSVIEIEPRQITRGLTVDAPAMSQGA